jgi:hypothetical protein
MQLLYSYFDYFHILGHFVPVSKGKVVDFVQQTFENNCTIYLRTVS